jgi:hypothetical protein
VVPDPSPARQVPAVEAAVEAGVEASGATPERARRWADARHLTRLLDSAIRIPGTQRRVGWDGIVGFIPGIGDAVGLTLAGIVIARGVLLGARGWTVARMVLVATVDALVGLIPFVGGIFDLVFKANERNLATLERHALDRERTERESRRVVVVMLAFLTVLVVAMVIGSALLIGWLVGQLR